jgi:hypothetical protein
LRRGNRIGRKKSEMIEEGQLHDPPDSGKIENGKGEELSGSV